MKRFVGPVLTLLALVVLNVLLPRVTNPYHFQVLILIGINIVLAVSLNLVNGFTGQFSIGHAGFMAVGAYASAMFTFKLGVPLVASLGALPTPVAQGVALLLALVAGGLLAAVAGWLVGLPSLRLRGDYLAIVTLGFGEIIRVVILNVDAIGGARGLPGIPAYANFFWVFGSVVAVVVLARNLAHSTHGRALFAIRDDEVAAEALGVDTTRYKVIAFVLGAFFAGVAGGLFAHFLSYLNPSSFTFLKSIEVIAMVVLGGMGSITGSIIAAVVLTLLPEVLRPVKEYRMVIYSLMLIILMITRPQGLMGNLESDFDGLGEWFDRMHRGLREKKGPLARLVLRPLLGALVGFWGVTDSVGNRPLRQTVRGLFLVALTALVAFLFVIALYLMLIVVALILALWIVGQILEVDTGGRRMFQASGNSRRAPFWGTEPWRRSHHYDATGKKIGESRRSSDSLGEKTEHFDRSGSRIGESRESSEFLGRRVQHFDASGAKTGESRAGSDVVGQKIDHFDASGERVGESREGSDSLGQKLEHHDKAGKKVGESRPDATGGEE